MSVVFDFTDNENFRYACEAGTTFKKNFQIFDDENNSVSLVGYTVKMVVRAVPVNLTATPLLTALTSGLTPKITVETDGTFTLSLTSVVTGALPVGRHVYAIDITATNGDCSRIMTGIFQVTENTEA